MNSEPVIRTHDLSVYYGTHRGIKDVNLSVRKGEIFGFLGPNGAGKTTTQRVILDIIHPTKGSATVFGLDSRKDGVAVRKHVSYLPGELSLYPSMVHHNNEYLVAYKLYIFSLKYSRSR
ncbi:MAG: ATP-binding cassette domain-containing protein [Candidatus Aminicenantes bacterium]|nr:ATP-binding cassette domain-containing protein [Candidatus Aminicenantes bacterium]